MSELELKVRDNPLVEMHPRAGDIVLGGRLYEEALSKRVCLSAYLEEIDPSRPDDNLDAFERQLMLSGIRVRSDPALGVYADKVEKFWESDKEGAEWLFPEFMYRLWRKAALRGFSPDLQQRFYMSSEPVSDVLYPSFIQGVARQKQIEPAIPLSELVATVTNVEGSRTYDAFYLTDDSDEYTERRVAEGAEVPFSKLTGGDHTIALKKYGRGLEGSYEIFQYMKIDRFALHIALLAVKAEADKVDTVIDLIVGGDGNANTQAENHDLSEMDDTATKGKLELKGWLNWLMQWDSPYFCNTVLGQNANILQVLMLNMGSANVPYFTLAGNFGIGGVTPLNRTLGGVRLGWTPSAPSQKLIGLDNRFGVEMLTQVSSSLTETNRLVRRQVNEIVFTEMVGFCVLDVNANKTLRLDA
jgi:hypothetical protein